MERKIESRISDFGQDKSCRDVVKYMKTPERGRSALYTLFELFFFELFFGHEYLLSPRYDIHLIRTYIHSHLFCFCFLSSKVVLKQTLVARGYIHFMHILST